MKNNVSWIILIALGLLLPSCNSTYSGGSNNGQLNIIGSWVQVDETGNPIYWNCEDSSHPGEGFYNLLIFTEQGQMLTEMASGDIISNILHKKFVSLDCNGVLYQHSYDFYPDGRLNLHLPDVFNGGERIVEHQLEFINNEMFEWETVTGTDYYKRLDNVFEQ